MSYTSRLLQTLLHRNFRKAGFEMSHEQWILLFILWQAGPTGISQQVLGQRTGKDKASITRLIQGLEDSGLVTRQPDPSDARIRLVCATPKAHRLEKSTHAILQETSLQVEQGLSPEEIQQVIHLLDRVRINAETALGRTTLANEWQDQHP